MRSLTATSPARLPAWKASAFARSGGGHWARGRAASARARGGAVGIRETGGEPRRRHRVAYEPAAIRQLDFGGEIHYRIQSEHHNWNPDTIYKLQHASEANDAKTYAEFAQLVNDESKRRSNLRGLLDFKFPPSPIPLEEVEGAKGMV